MYDGSMSVVSEIENPAPESYGILFIGLACFVKERKKRLVFLPDGTNVANITPHETAIVVDPNNIIDAAGWPATERDVTFRDLGIYVLPESTLTMSGLDVIGAFDTKQHDEFVPRLKSADPRAEIDPKVAKPRVRVDLTSGILEAFITPRPDPDQPDAPAVISRLTVSHSEEIEVKVNGQVPLRTLRLKPGTNIAIANVVFSDDGSTVSDDFAIYGGITTKGSIRSTVAPTVDPLTPKFPGSHYIFELPFAIHDGGVKCGNTGCC